MSQILKKHIQKFVQLPDEEYPSILAFFKPMAVNKKVNLLREGEICKNNYFVEKGCLRMYFVKEKGIEQTIQFAIENWWLADYLSFGSRQKSEFFIQAVEKSELLTIDYSSQEKMFKRFPYMERYFRCIHLRAHSAAQYRIKFLYQYSREELYHQFIRLYPEFVQRVPQYLLASYLGFTPEYLSEIRGKKLS